jgi:hypothetical protein
VRQHIEQKGKAIEFVQLVSKQCQGKFAAFGLALSESFGKMRGIITSRYFSVVTFDAALFSAFRRLFQSRRLDILAATPPMGWNSWDSYGRTLNEESIKACQVDGRASSVSAGSMSSWMRAGTWPTLTLTAISACILRWTRMVVSSGARSLSLRGEESYIQTSSHICTHWVLSWVFISFAAYPRSGTKESPDR